MTPLDDRRALKNALEEYFDDSELADLSFSLDVDYDELPGENRNDKARSLIAYLGRRGRIADLVAACKKLRPHVTWRGPGVLTLDERVQLLQAGMDEMQTTLDEISAQLKTGSDKDDDVNETIDRLCGVLSELVEELREKTKPPTTKKFSLARRGG